MSDVNTTAQAFTGFEVPINIDNEGLIISNALKSAEYQGILSRRAPYTKFRNPQFQALAWAVNNILEKGLEVTPDLVLIYAKSCPVRSTLDFDFITTIMANFEVVTLPNYEEHISLLNQDAVKASVLHTITNGTIKRCLDPKSTISDISSSLEYMKRQVDDGYSAIRCEFMGMDELITQFVEEKNSNTNFRSTGFSQLDALLSEGLKEKTITTICGLSGMGKSSLLLSMLKNLSNKGVHTGLFALEMHNMAVVTKILSYVSNISVKTITKNYKKMSDIEKSILDAEMLRLSGNQFLHINDKPQSLRNIEEQTMVLQDLLGTHYIPTAIDLFGKIKDVRGSKNVAQDYESQLNYAQEMAKRLDTPLILVAQINREVTKRKFNRPTMADLKNSNAFAEVSDLMIGVHRPYYDAEKALKDEIDKGSQTIQYGDDDEDDFMVDDPLKNLLEVIIMKQRMGAGNKIVRMYFDPNTTCCTPIPQEYQNLFNAVGLEDDGF